MLDSGAEFALESGEPEKQKSEIAAKSTGED